MWECDGNAVGVREEDVGMNVKFIYDHVLDANTTNQQAGSAGRRRRGADPRRRGCGA